MNEALPRAGSRSSLTVLSVGGLALLAADLARPSSANGRWILSATSGVVAGLLAAGTILLARRSGAAGAGNAFAGAAACLAGALVGGLAAGLGRSVAGSPGDAPLLLLAVAPAGAFLVAGAYQEIGGQFRDEERRELLLDLVLVAALLASTAYLGVRPPATEVGLAGTVSTLALALFSVAPAAVWAVVDLWAPSARNLGLFLANAALGAGALALAHEWLRGSYAPATLWVDLPLQLGLLALAGLVLVGRRPGEGEARSLRPPAGRSVATAGAVVGVAAGIALVGSIHSTGRITGPEAAVLVSLLTLALGSRIVMNRAREARGAETRAELVAKDRALRKTDAALSRLQELNETLQVSEERLRHLFDAAADGIVELDSENVIVRVNEAFCSMVDLPEESVVGHGWDVVADRIEGGGPSLDTLLATGEGTIEREGQQLHLETRSSDLPGPNPGRMLVIRDVTAARVADQTIRTLFKFLQDRDEDRSRILRRTNAAIEAERNRIARDLHDGPVQGVAAATLSLEAALLLLNRGESERAVGVLTKIREELAEETDNLRRLMGDLRPPVLDERGLVPALRETLARFGRDFGIRTRFSSRALVDIPADVETLAYRIVQEALTNAGKHSGATEVALSVEAVADQLRVEVSDDGDGFDPARAREYLRAGRVGLASMRERTELGGGSFLVRSSGESGTTVVATLPLETPRSPAEAVLS